jgi:hypothetical protein
MIMMRWKKRMKNIERRKSRLALQIAQTLEQTQTTIEMSDDGSPSALPHTQTPPSNDTTGA